MLKYYNIILLVFILACCLVALLKKDKDVTHTQSKIMELVCQKEKAILIVIALIGVAIRVWQFGQVPGGVNQDGAMAAVDANALAMYGTDRFGTFMPAHLYAWGYAQMSSLMSYLMVPWIWVFGLNVVTMRLPILVMSLIGGVFLWLFSRDAFGKSAGILAAFFCAVNPWHFVQSRWALEANMLPHFFILGICLLFLFCKGKKPALYLSMLSFGLCMYCYGVSIYTIPVFLVMACIYLLAKHLVNVKQVLLCVLLYLLISWPFYLTMAINTFGWQTIEFPFVTCQLFPDSVRAGDILLFSEHPLEQLKENLKCMFDILILQRKNLAWNDIEGFGTMYRFSLPFAVCGVAAMYRKRENPGMVLLIFALITGVICGILTNEVNINRENIIYYPMMPLIVLGIDYVVTKLDYLFLPIVECYMLSALLLLGAYFGDYADEIKSSFYYGFGDALTAAEETGSERIYITANTQFEDTYDVSLILTMFYDKTDAQYFQGKTNINHGEECLPFSERFLIMGFKPDRMPEIAEKSVCVISKYDEYLFTDGYDITEYGEYALAISK